MDPMWTHNYSRAYMVPNRHASDVVLGSVQVRNGVAGAGDNIHTEIASEKTSATRCRWTVTHARSAPQAPSRSVVRCGEPMTWWVTCQNGRRMGTSVVAATTIWMRRVVITPSVELQVRPRLGWAIVAVQTHF